MDILPLILIVVISVAVILLWFRGKQQRSQGVEGEGSNLPAAILLASWLVASAVMGPYFFILRFGGIFDITIERLLFIMVLAVLGAGLFTGKVNLRSGITIEMTMMAFVLICVVSMIRNGLFVQVRFFLPHGLYLSPAIYFRSLFMFMQKIIFAMNIRSS